MGPRAHAELIADGGAAASGDELFRTPVFLEAEEVTHTLRLSSADRIALVPLIVRDVAGSEFADAISPYGYPGARVEGSGPPPASAEVDWAPAGLVSIFARERLVGDPWLAGPRERGSVLVHDPASPRRVKPRLAGQIRANVRAGWVTETIPGPESDSARRQAFARLYEQTMRRAGAAERYFFARDYLDAVLSFERSWLILGGCEGEVGAAAIAAVSDGILHYYLGGTADSARRVSPFKNVCSAMLDLADELELLLNLGGGVSEGDGLERFKRGFANAELPFRTQDVICDAGEYERLAGSGAGDDDGFFPAYRGL